ncbi:class I SAM-dependent methyltransferase, partial [Chamaesiphon sp. OTE_20_metabat_361]|uniref:class I SAM-dependent methyltransferase n=1 Tax=Chamaesiphon sp. OTE_20_metabat_361 TaxID=2964689 RepID=UPI00286BFA70
VTMVIVAAKDRIPKNMTKSRTRVRELSTAAYANGDYTGWFETLYAEADGNLDAIPWADRAVNPWLLDWVKASQLNFQNLRVLVVGCGLGDDAEYLAGLGAKVTAFDLSQTAIDWCHTRFPSSKVNYQAVDLFTAPAEWKFGFDLVIEIYTIQALPANIRPNAIESIGNFVAPAGKLLVVCRGRNPEDACESLPFPLTKDELHKFIETGLTEVSFADSIDEFDITPARRFRIVHTRSN